MKQIQVEIPKYINAKLNGIYRNSTPLIDTDIKEDRYFPIWDATLVEWLHKNIGNHCIFGADSISRERVEVQINLIGTTFFNWRLNTYCFSAKTTKGV